MIRLTFAIAIVLLLTLPSLAQDEAIGKNNEGVKKLNVGDYKGAIGDFTESLRLKPGYIIALVNRAIAHNHLKQHKKALADYSEALRISPDDFWVLSGHAKTLVSLKAYRKALVDYDRLVDLNQGSRSWSLRKRADVRAKLHDEEGAKSDLDRANAIDAENPSP